MFDHPLIDRYRNKYIGVTGHRNIPRDCFEAVIDKMWQVVEGEAKEIVFGGARGVDTIALQSAREACFHLQKKTWLRVVVPGVLGQQPRDAQDVILRCADEVIELGLDLSDPASYEARNRYIAASDLLVAFWNGEKRGGTWMTIRLATDAGIEVEYVQI